MPLSRPYLCLLCCRILSAVQKLPFSIIVTLVLMRVRALCAALGSAYVSTLTCERWAQ